MYFTSQPQQFRTIREAVLSLYLTFPYLKKVVWRTWSKHWRKLMLCVSPRYIPKDARGDINRDGREDIDII
jgi:hypothetical protein